VGTCASVNWPPWGCPTDLRLWQCYAMLIVFSRSPSKIWGTQFRSQFVSQFMSIHLVLNVLLETLVSIGFSYSFWALFGSMYWYSLGERCTVHHVHLVDKWATFAPNLFQKQETPHWHLSLLLVSKRIETIHYRCLNRPNRVCTNITKITYRVGEAFLQSSWWVPTFIVVKSHDLSPC